MLGGQWRGCQASVVLARVTRKENVRALSSLSSTSVSESRISSHVNNPINKINLREISNSSRIIQVRNLTEMKIWQKYSLITKWKYTNLKINIVFLFEG